MELEAQKKLRERERRRSKWYVAMQDDHDQILWNNSINNDDNENKGFNSDDDDPNYSPDGGSPDN